MSKRILVTGGSGFIGTNFIKILIRETDWEIVNLDENIDTGLMIEEPMVQVWCH